MYTKHKRSTIVIRAEHQPESHTHTHIAIRFGQFSYNALELMQNGTYEGSENKNKKIVSYDDDEMLLRIIIIIIYRHLLLLLGAGY